jgi:hypothetical protein
LALLPAWPLLGGCEEDRRNLPPQTSAATPAPAPVTTPEPSSSSGPGIPPSPAPEKDEKEQRGNTPPGMDRSGGGPMEGAIRDPAGVVTKQPEPKETVK